MIFTGSSLWPAYLPQNLIAVDIRKLNVQNNEMRLLGNGHFNAISAGFSADCGVSVMFENIARFMLSGVSSITRT